MARGPHWKKSFHPRFVYSYIWTGSSTIRLHSSVISNQWYGSGGSNTISIDDPYIHNFNSDMAEYSVRMNPCAIYPGILTYGSTVYDGSYRAMLWFEMVSYYYERSTESYLPHHRGVSDVTLCVSSTVYWRGIITNSFGTPKFIDIS